MNRLALLIAVALVAVPETVSAQARAGLERARTAAAQRAWEAIFRELDDCAAVPVATLDILRHGYALIHHEDRQAGAASNRALLGEAAGTAAGMLGLPFNPVNMIGRQWQPVESASRAEYILQLRQEFHDEVTAADGLRSQCSQWAEDVAWSYAPSDGSECRGLTNEPVDTLRQSGEFFGQDRWEVRLMILHRYRASDRTGNCLDYADELASTARVLDP